MTCCSRRVCVGRPSHTQWTTGPCRTCPARYIMQHYVTYNELHMQSCSALVIRICQPLFKTVPCFWVVLENRRQMMYTEHVVSSTCRKKKLFHDRSSVNLRSLLRQTARQSYRRQHAVGNGKLDVTLLRLHSDTEPESHSTVDSLKLPVDI